MKRKGFYSFHYKPDNWRVATIRNIGVIEGNSTVSDNDWETVKRAGQKSIQNWIDGQLKGKSCTIVLIGEETAGRKWINYEIEESWNLGKGVLGIHIHNIKDKDGKQSRKGKNPFKNITLENGKVNLSDIVKTYDPPYVSSSNVYKYISENLEGWIEEAIAIRKNYKK